MKKYFFLLVGAALLLSEKISIAQNFNQENAFGTSLIDSGWYKVVLANGGTTGNAGRDALVNAAIAADGGAYGGPVGALNLMGSQLLASKFGLAANPANQSGGTNYAINGALTAAVAANNNTTNIGDPNSVAGLASTVQQVSNYLAANGGKANSSGLFLIDSGGNDISYAIKNIAGLAAQQAYLNVEAAQLTTAVQSLQSAGAKYIIVHDQVVRGAASDPSGLSSFYNQALLSALGNAGIKAIPSDINAMAQAVMANPTAFGFTAATVQPGVLGAGTGSACVSQNGAVAGTPTGSGWGQWCANTTVASANYAYLRSANSEYTSFFADDQHFSLAGQQIEADYDYSLLVAPSEISLLAESAVQTTFATVTGIQQQIDIAQNQRPSGLNAWGGGQLVSAQ